MMRALRHLAATAVLCMAWGFSTSAHAGLVTLGPSPALTTVHDLKSFWNSTFDVTEFVGTVAGTVTLSVQRIEWGDPLSLKTTLSLPGLPATQLTGNAITTFQLAAGDSFTAMVLAQAQGPLGFGAYQLDVSFMPNVAEVPLPAAGWLMLSGCALLLRARRRRIDALA